MFKFRLQAVLEYRQFLEDRKKAELAEKQRIYMEQKRKSELLRERRYQYHEAMRRESARDEIDVTMLTFYQAYIIVIENQTVVQDKRMEDARLKMVESQKELIEAKKQKEVMVKARDRARKKYQYEEGLRNQKLLDDVASIKYTRASRGMD